MKLKLSLKLDGLDLAEKVRVLEKEIKDLRNKKTYCDQEQKNGFQEKITKLTSELAQMRDDLDYQIAKKQNLL